MAAVTKFAYLKDLLEPKVRAGIDGLPFSSEGYERTKNILWNKYGKTSEIVNAYVQSIMGLPVINGANPAKIHQSYEALSFNVQALETLGKLKEVNGYVRMSINKLPGIRGDLIRTDENWQEWDFPKFVYALQGWTERIPVTTRSSDKSWRDSNAFNTQLGEVRPRGCVYCNSTDHKPHECTKVTDPRWSQDDGMQEQKNVFVLQKKTLRLHLWQRKRRQLDDSYANWRWPCGIPRDCRVSCRNIMSCPSRFWRRKFVRLCSTAWKNWCKTSSFWVAQDWDDAGREQSGDGSLSGQT